jgi:hypothetical protein
MKRLLAILALCCAPLLADTTGVPAGGIAKRFVRFTGAPAACSEGDAYYDLTAHSAWICNAAGVWVVVGSGSGSVTSVGLAGTANQISVTGASPITGSGSWTLSFPAGGVTLPGTTTGTFTGNVTGTASAASASDHSPTACGANTFAQSQSTVWAFTCAAVPLAALATQAANTVVANATSGTATPTAFAMPSCVAPNALIWTTSTGFGCNSTVAATNADNSFTASQTLTSGVVTNLNLMRSTITGGVHLQSNISAGGVADLSLSANASTTGSANNLDDTGKNAWNLTLSNQLDQVLFRRAAAAGNPVTYVNYLTLDGATGAVIHGTPTASEQGSASKTLTESSATAFVVITVANSSACAGRVDYTVFAADATNTQAKSGELFFATVANSSGTVTKATISDVNTLNPVSSGTLTNTMTDTTGANTYTLLANAVSSLTQTTLNIKYLVHITSGTCTVTAQ